MSRGGGGAGGGRRHVAARSIKDARAISSYTIILYSSTLARVDSVFFFNILSFFFQLSTKMFSRISVYALHKI